MKVYKTLQFPECTTTKSVFSFSVHANSKLLLETVFPRTQYAMTASYPSEQIHTQITLRFPIQVYSGSYSLQRETERY